MQEVFAPPPDSPNTITLCGSPPNTSIFSCTHLSPAAMSSIPWIAGTDILFAGKVSQEQISQESQTMISCHDDNIVLSSEIAAILVPSASGSNYESTSMVVEHNGATTVIDCRRPNVQHQAILGRKWFLGSERRPSRLERRWPGSERVTNTGPRRSEEHTS